MNWLNQLFSRRGIYSDLSEEIQQHLDEKAEALMAVGMGRREAQHTARREFGNVTLLEERSREVWLWPRLEGLWSDLRYAVGQLRKNSGFTTAAVLTLALGIGANLTVFLILYGVLLRPLPFPTPSQLIRIERFYPDGEMAPAYSGTEALFMRRASRTLESAAAYDYVPSYVNLVQGREAVPLNALRVTSDFFHVFQMEPVMGRGFRPLDMEQHAPGVAVLSDAMWKQRFAADKNIVGHTITLGSGMYTVVGIASPRFRLDTKVDVWVPLRIAESAVDRSNEYNFVARIKPSVTRAQAQDDLKRVLLELKNVYPHLWNQNESVRVLDFHDSLTGHVRPALEMLMGAVGLLLVIVAANILSLLLTRAIARRREMSLRAALGASGWRILRQLLVENVMLCVIGGIAGVLLAAFAAPALMRLSPLNLPQFTSLQIGVPMLIFAAALIFLCALLFSLVPASESRRAQLNESLKLNPSQVAGGRNLAQKSLVVGEVAASLMLLVAAALLLASFWKLIRTRPGFDAQNVTTFKTSFTNEQTATSATMGRLLNELTVRLKAQPGIEAAAAVNSLPTQLAPDLPFDIMGRPAGQQGSGGDETFIPITAGYFDALRVPLISGRSFSLSDTHRSEPVVIVNRQFAQTYFKGRNPVGEHIRIGAAMGPGFEDSVREIAGVVGDTRQAGLDKPTPGIMYLPMEQLPDKEEQMSNRLAGTSWVVRTKSPRIDVAATATRIFMKNARTPLLSIEPMRDVMRASVAQQRFTMLLLCAFGVISLVLGGTGLYGVMSYTVARQTKEIGVRMANGARRGDILGMVLREAGLLVVFGLILGTAASLACAQLLRGLLQGIAPRDPLALGSMCVVLLLTGLFAAWWPARRAAAIEPMEALRTE